MRRYLRIWWLLTSAASQIAFQSRFGAVIFLIGKILRFGLFLVFIFIITGRTKEIAEYSVWQIVFFFATFNLIDALPMFFLREVYRFRIYIVKGTFDYILAMPISPLFRALLGGSDILDLTILLLALFLVGISFFHIGPIPMENVILYIILICNAMVMALSFHIFVLGMGILTTTVDNAIMLYRDLTQMGRVPIDVYREPFRAIFTFVIPIGIMMTFPAKALMGILSLQFIFISLVTGILLFGVSVWFWRFALKRYASASS
ncbi:MAG: ABC-2 family transporter protein [Candidatus Levybacteria bacterium]|nr:ABC-2 family transporter protein [Candidatus Levybacteria bacterium]